MATKKKYNFKGLDEIFGESVSDLVGVLENNPEKAKETAMSLEITKLKPNPYQPRRVFDEDGIKELSESIKLHGIIQPIIVNKNDSSFEIVAGERRFRAAQIAGLKEVPVVILNLSAQQMEEFAIIENIQRVDLTDIEEAIAYKQLSTNLKLKQDEIGQRVGKSRSHVANVMRLLNLPQNIQDAMLKGTVSMGQAKPLLTVLSDEKFVQAVFQRILKENLTSREVEELVKNKNKGLAAPEPKRKDASYVKVENQLMRRFGTKVVIDSNKISLKYSGMEDLNRILELLGLENDD